MFKVALDTRITPELKAKGQINDLFRLVAVLRKYYKLKPEEPLIISNGKSKLKLEKI